MAEVWILSQGEMHEGGEVLGVYATRDAAKGAFAQAAQALPFGIDDAHQDRETGAIRLDAGCDWLALDPHEVTTRPELPGGAS